MESEYKQIGKIALKDKVYISDPCYQIMTWCQAYLSDVLPGEYACFIKMFEERVAELLVVHKDFLGIHHNEAEEVPFCIDYVFSLGVDSGQMGIFDADYYEENQPNDDFNNTSSWYRRVCDTTCEQDAGVLDNLGVVSSSGYGDGSYPLYISEEDDKIVAMKVVFIDEEDF